VHDEYRRRESITGYVRIAISQPAARAAADTLTVRTAGGQVSAAAARVRAETQTRAARAATSAVVAETRTIGYSCAPPVGHLVYEKGADLPPFG